eukprot:TRINITY_DN306_c0_g1_i1.p1 TRINITY_DN306_c0_g1~~TRINITY_DN306_c0_g1_i1.p1  ORF type:complete len:584 (+),score=213.85 TRINITY_DN306_c0_g1_i1:72-1823(+)
MGGYSQGSQTPQGSEKAGSPRFPVDHSDIPDAEIQIDIDNNGKPRAPSPHTTVVSTSANLNVRLALAFTFFSSVGRGIWAFATLSVYLQQLTGGTVAVGVAEGIQGLVQALIAPVAGWAADRYRRDTIMSVAGLVGLAAAITMSAGLMLGAKIHPGGHDDWDWLSDHTRFAIMSVALGVWGAYQGVWNTSLETIFADSIPTGSRSYYNMYKFVLMQAANVTGPLVAIILYICIGGAKTDWSQNTVIWVFQGGIIACLPAMIMLFFFSDDHMRGRAAAAHTEKKPLLAQQAEDSEDDEAAYHFLGLSVHHVPHIVIASNLINGIGAGMTIKFFPLFFAKEIGLSPVGTNAIYVGLPVLMVFAGKGAQRLSRSFGRVQVSILYICIGSAMLAVLWAIGEWWPCSDGDSGESSGDGSCHWPTHRFWYLILPIYLISTAPHMTFPLTQSILMDYVPKHKRGRWNSLASVTRFGWSGSAMVGGFIVNKWGYGPSFLITAIMQVISAGILALLLPLMTEERAVTRTAPAGKEEAPVGSDQCASVSGYSHAPSMVHTIVESIAVHMSPATTCDFALHSAVGPSAPLVDDD